MLSEPAIKKLQHKVQRKADVFPAVFRALGDRTRFLMFSLLVEQKELCVTDIARIFTISVPAASHQLKILENAGLVRRERMGQMICYEPRRDTMMLRLIIRLLSIIK